MTLPQSWASYADAFDHFERALNSARGTRIPFEDFTRAQVYRNRLHHARVVDRRRNTEGVEPGTPTYGASQYDAVVVRIRNIDGQIYLYLEPTRLSPIAEDIPEEEPCQTLPPPQPKPLLAGPSHPPSPSNSGTSQPGTSSVSPSPSTRRIPQT